MPHDLIDLLAFPSMPGPLHSDSAGETWVWGDYVLVLQTNPENVSLGALRMLGKPTPPQVMTYPYAMTVFYRMDRNPHGPSHRPILVACLEKMDAAAAVVQMRAQGMDPAAQGLHADTEMPVVVGIFTAAKRMNLGEYHGQLDQESARAHLMQMVGERLAPEGDPEYIGPISAIYGHPSTGFPLQPKKKPKGGLGCLVIGAMAVCGIALCGMAFAWCG